VNKPLAQVSLAQALLAPQSVAIIGQSNDATKTAGRPLKYLRQAGYAGRIYPINPRRDTVLGERAWPSLAALPEVPDHAYIVASTDATMEAIEECGRLGVPVVTALANGFSEAGAEGTAREARIRDIIKETGTRIVGPSSLGVVDLRHKTFLTANAAFDEPDLPVGRVFAASHSGGMIGTFLSRGKARGIHFAGLVSVGNEVDLSIGEICQATLEDPGIDGYVLFLETMRKADALRTFALEAAARGKPVLAYKLGRSAAARELAVSHTGALAGEDDIAGMFLAECGIARVDTLEGLIEGFPLLGRVPSPARDGRRPTVAVVTTTAGGATMVVDPLAMRGVAVEPPTPQTLARLKGVTGVDVTPARIVDLTLAGAQYNVMKGALDVLTIAPEFDLVVVTVPARASRSRHSLCPKRLTRWRVLQRPACRTSTRRRLAPMPWRLRCSDARRALSKRRLGHRRAKPRCLTSWRPIRFSTASAFRTRRPSHSTPASRKRQRCRSPIPSR
jgi:acyl-CoA synthetase (NDP forming)